MSARNSAGDLNILRVAPAAHERVLITGGAGFIGTNLAHRLLSEGREVLVFDNFSRQGVERNVKWLRNHHGPRFQLVRGDVRDEAAVQRVVANAGRVFHFAAQVAVTKSLIDPGDDFEVNARGTLNVLNAIRAQRTPPPLIFTSTNKVYGALAEVELRETELRYEPTNKRVRSAGINEERQLDFHSPYGCSKGAADQYVLDYARSYGMPTAVFRMSCIYGPQQFGTEDQGWVAHFMIKALAGEPLVLYGNGKQVRDLLFVDDLIDAFLIAEANIERLSGNAYNMGGGPARTTSLLELLDRLEALNECRPTHTFEPPRVGDQSYYVSDTSRFSASTGWSARVDVSSGLLRLQEWLLHSRARVAAASTWGRDALVSSPVVRRA